MAHFVESVGDAVAVFGSDLCGCEVGGDDGVELSVVACGEQFDDGIGGVAV